MEKMTNRKALDYVLTHYDLPNDVKDKLNAMVEAINKKNSAERKPTAKQVENDALRDALVQYIYDNSVDGSGFTISELLKECECVKGLSNQKVSALMRIAKENKQVSKTTIKRKTYFVPYDSKYDEVEVEGE